MKKVYVFLSVVIPILVISSLIWRPTVTHASFNSNNVMDDIVFTNVNSMGESAIQNFLNRWPSGCLTNYQAPYPVDYFTFGGNVSAASVIYRAAQYWGLNPQVILATLQKESSVVTGDASYGCQYINTAMGYDCPDAGSCPVHASNLGFSQQVMHAAWQLRFNQERSYGNIGWDGDSSVYYYGYMTQGNRARVQGGSTIYYDGTATIDGTLVYMSNGATASLYSYTPHFHGNQNFYSLFNSWFGDTIYHGVPYAHPNGTLVRNSNELQVYLIENGQRLPVPTAESLFSFNYNFGDIRFANYYDDQMPVVSPLPLLKEGTVFKGSGPAIYTYRIVAGIPQKQHFPTWETFTGLGYRLQDVMTVPDWEIPSANYASDVDSSQHPVGALVQPAGHLEVYYLDPNGTKRLFTNQESFYSWRYWFGQVKRATIADTQLPTGTPMGYKEGILIKGSGPQIYTTDPQQLDGSQQKSLISSWYCFVQFNYNYPNDVLGIADWELASLPTTGPVC